MARFLLIEDNPQNANLAIRVLERAGHEVVHSADGVSGIQQVNKQPIDMVLLDLHLPDLDGHMVATFLGRLPDRVPIIAVTASTEEITLRRAKNVGCKGIIHKPINTRTFAAEVEAYLLQIQQESAPPDPIAALNGDGRKSPGQTP